MKSCNLGKSLISVVISSLFNLKNVMNEATASARGFLSSFEEAIHLQKSPFSFPNKFEICMCCRRG